MSQFRKSPQNQIIWFSLVALLRKRSGRVHYLAFAIGVLLSLWWLGCEQISQTAVDPSFGPPVLVQASSSISAVNTDTINVGTSRKPEDTLTITLTVTARASSEPNRPVPTVQMRIMNPYDNTPLSAATMMDDGSAGDQVKGDGIFTVRTSFQIQRVQIGTLTIEVVAVGSNGYRSNTLLLPLKIFRGNQAPQIALVQAADTVQLSTESQVLILRLRVTDQDGIGDITRVFFNSYLPSGSASSGNPFLMYDDGSPTHGDEKAGDGIFGLLITLPPTTPPGTYRFEFQAVDRSNAVSNLLIHPILVKP